MDATALLACGFHAEARRMTLDDVRTMASRYGVEVPVVQAVLDVESSGSGYDADGRPKILPEPHILYQQLLGDPNKLAVAVRAGLAYPRQGAQPYPVGSEANYQRLKRGCLIDPGAAMRSASWGCAQVMGFNYAVCGYPDVFAMVEACLHDEVAQLDLLFRYAKKNGLIYFLQTRNWAAFARGYNGPGAVAAYAAKLALAYARHLVGIPPNGPRMILLPEPVTPSPAAVVRTALAPLQQPPMTTDSLNDQEFLRIRAGIG